MATRMQQRRGTATMWTNANPILGVAEIGYETDTNKFKIGDGTNRWADLSYFVDLDTMIEGAPGLLNSLDEIAAAIGDDPAFFTTIATGLAAKAPLASPTFTGTVSGVTNAHVGLGSVDNTSDSAKPVSTATQTALDSKASNTALANHEADTTNIHGIADTSLLATTANVATAVSTAASDATTKANAAQSAATTAAATDATTKANAAQAAAASDATTKADAAKAFATAADTTLRTAITTDIATAKSEAITAATDAVNAVIASAPAALDTLDELAAALGDDANYAATITTALAAKAPLASPALTGNPTAPTQTLGNDSTRVATTAFVKAAIQDIASLNLVLDGGGV